MFGKIEIKKSKVNMNIWLVKHNIRIKQCKVTLWEAKI